SSMLDGSRSTPSSWCRMLLETSTALSSIMSCMIVESVSGKGEVVDTLTTGEDGTAESKELYLGKYEVKEITAPYGMVLSDEVHAVELVYAGQEIEVTETGTDFYNERQCVEIDLNKALEVDEAYGVGSNGEIKDVTFGLYADEELTAADGSVIPADGLIEVIFLDENGHGKAISDLPMTFWIWASSYSLSVCSWCLTAF
ncbi:prealbumin-like fold domain-containing protein, partial [Acutalibacter muris]|uniref:prealbumin-like fold domain-containing protein n=1 Tax=Acutalibacter muris TaxID=1796620 RepID=UPI003FA4936E